MQRIFPGAADSKYRRGCHGVEEMSSTVVLAANMCLPGNHPHSYYIFLCVSECSHHYDICLGYGLHGASHAGQP